MPLVEVKVFEDELTPQQSQDLIQKITQAVTTVVSPKIRDAVWVVIHEIKSGHWGVGGRTLGVDDVRKAIES
jgi:4-oxalocrotonate tautomerase